MPTLSAPAGLGPVSTWGEVLRAGLDAWPARARDGGGRSGEAGASVAPRSTRGQFEHGRLTGAGVPDLDPDPGVPGAGAGAGAGARPKSSSMMATPSLTTMLPGHDACSDQKSPAEVPGPSLLLSVRRTDEGFANDCPTFGFPGAPWRLLFAVSDRMPRIGEESRRRGQTADAARPPTRPDRRRGQTADAARPPGRRPRRGSRGRGRRPDRVGDLWLRAVRCGQYHGAAPPVLTRPRFRGGRDGTMGP
jgi:hypothetical protein